MVGLLVVLLSGLAAVGVVVPACGFTAENLANPAGDGGAIPDSPPDMFIPDAAPCSSATIKTCANETTLRACMTTGMYPTDQPCAWGCTEPVPGNARCKTFTPSGGAVSAADLDRAAAVIAGLQKRTFSTTLGIATIDTQSGAIQIGSDTRQGGMGVRDGVDFKVVNNVAIFRFLELDINSFQRVRVVGPNALALVGIDRIGIGDATVFDLQGTCSGRSAGPGGGQGGAANGAGSGVGAGGAGDATGVCSGGGGAGHASIGGNGGGRANGGGTNGLSTIQVLVGGAGGGGGGNGGDGGGGGGAIHLVSNGAIVFDAATAFQVGIQAGGCNGKAGTCGGGAGAGGAILIEGRTADFSGAHLAVNGGGGGGAANGANGEIADVFTRADGGGGGIGPGSNDDGGDGGGGRSSSFNASSGGVRDGRGGGGGGGGGWIRINTQNGLIGGSVFVTPSASMGMANVQ